MSRLISLLMVFCVGCGSMLPPAPTLPSDDPAFAPAELAEPAGLDEDPPRSLALMPGDIVSLTTVSVETTIYEGLRVDEMGNLHVQLAGDVDVGGVPFGVAEARIETALRTYDRHVRVSLILEVPSGHRATVVGAVTTPGRVEVLPGSRLSDLLALAGGPMVVFSEEEDEAVMLADIEGARLVREGEAVPVSLMRALLGDPRHNIRVRAGDHLFVPPLRGNHIVVLGQVNAARAVHFRRGIRLSEALARAGGVNERGDRTDIRVIRGSLREPRVYRTSLRALYRGDGTDVELIAGDIVFVTEEWTASAGEVLARLSPLISLASATTLGVILAQ